MRSKDASIRNLIFDLGGVIINLAPNKTVDAFAHLSGMPQAEVLRIYSTQPVFHEYEKGLVTDEEFRTALRGFFSASATDAELDACWNAMLLDIPVPRIELLRKLRTNHALFLLSNTNNIHLQCFNGIVHNTTGQVSLDEFFDRAYYSHLMKMRKPDEEIYEYVLKQHDLTAAETLFLDDNRANLEGAQRVGIQTFHVEHPDLIFNLFHES